MAKKVYAVTNINAGNGNVYDAGDLVDHSKFSKDQLKELLDAGAIELRDEEESKDSELETEVQPTMPDMETVEFAPEAQGEAPKAPEEE